MPAELHILSGGVESTGALYRRMMETDNVIHVLHMTAPQPHAVAHTQAARGISIWLAKNARMITYAEWASPVMGGRGCASSPFATLGFLVGQYIVRNPFISLVVQGTNGEGDASERSLLNNSYMEGVAAAVCAGNAPAPTWVRPHTALTKRQIFEVMPPALQSLCWTCISPKVSGDVFVPCGACQKCLEFNAIMGVR